MDRKLARAVNAAVLASNNAVTRYAKRRACAGYTPAFKIEHDHPSVNHLYSPLFQRSAYSLAGLRMGMYLSDELIVGVILWLDFFAFDGTAGGDTLHGFV
jgi:hypothetical protein